MRWSIYLLLVVFGLDMLTDVPEEVQWLRIPLIVLGAIILVVTLKRRGLKTLRLPGRQIDWLQIIGVESDGNVERAFPIHIELDVGKVG